MPVNYLQLYFAGNLPQTSHFYLEEYKAGVTNGG